MYDCTHKLREITCFAPALLLLSKQFMITDTPVVNKTSKVTVNSKGTTSTSGKVETDSTDFAEPLAAGKEPKTEVFSLKPEVHSGLRDYQWELALPGLSGQNYIICAPTGTGKTRVAALIISEHLARLKGRGTVMFVVNKIPLARQQKLALEDMIHGAKIAEITGEVAQYKKASVSPATGSSSPDTVEKFTRANKFTLKNNDITVCTAGCALNELKTGRLNMSDISLIVVDECHHTRKNSPYSKIMELYLQEKLNNSTASSSSLPQVIGLTATPGAGNAPKPNLLVTLDHLISLCARMDALGGIKVVEKNELDLEEHKSRAEFTLAVVNGRNEDDPVISLINQIMTMLEKMYSFRCPDGSISRWSQQYNSWLKGMLQEYHMKVMPNSRNIISALQLLECLSSFLVTYLDLQYEDALEVLDDLTIPGGDNATTDEKQLVKVVQQLRCKLATLPRTDNPLLKQLEHVLVEQFQHFSKSKAIIFVETKKQATSVCRWISSVDTLAHIKAGVVTGQTRETGLKMTITDQVETIKGFREDQYNLLIATSVLEEGIDIPACNLVIRYQKVTSDIAKVQTQGRARAANSQSFSIISSESGKQYQELVNEEKLSIVEEALKFVPVGEQLRTSLRAKQREIVKNCAEKEIESAKRRQLYSPYEVEVVCKKCKAFVCNGSDIHTLKTTLHYIVSDPDIYQRMVVRDHDNPTTIANGMSRTQKMFCLECDQKWGIIGRWWENRSKYPVLKCCNLFFKINGEYQNIKKWTEVPFEVTRLP